MPTSTKNGITITYTETVPTGVDVTGEPCFGGTITVTAISPAPTGSGATRRNGAMLNPSSVQVQGYDGRMNDNLHMEYSDSVSVSLPITLNPGDCLVCSISDASSSGQYLTDMAAFSVLASIPATPFFRPGYAGRDRKVRLVSNMTLAAVPSYARPFDPIATETNFDHFKPTANSKWLNRFQYRLVKPTAPSWDKMTPSNHQEAYPGQQAKIIAQIGGLAVTTGAQRTESIYKLARLGIDIAACLRAVGTNIGPYYALNGAGYGGGWAFPLMFAAQVFADRSMFDLLHMPFRSTPITTDLPGASYTSQNPDGMGIRVGTLFEYATFYSSTNSRIWESLATPKRRSHYFPGFPLYGDPNEGNTLASPGSNESRRSTGIYLDANWDGENQYGAAWPFKAPPWGGYQTIASSVAIGNAIPAFLMGMQGHYPKGFVDYFFRWVSDSKMWYSSAGSAFYNDIYGFGGSGNGFMQQIWETHGVDATADIGDEIRLDPPYKIKVIKVGGKRAALTDQGVRVFR